MSARPIVLILGGTGEARELARRAASETAGRVIYSLAGRTARPVLPECEVRRGGFGGTAGLATYLREAAIDRVIDATHPFAATMSRNAVAACEAAGVPRLVLRRPAWIQQQGDDWRIVADSEAAAAALPDGPLRVFLSLGHQRLAPFARRSDLTFLVRLTEAPKNPHPLPGARILIQRGPFNEAGERELLCDEAIDWLVARNSGGDATYAKIAAARALGIPVVMIRRPDVPPGDTVDSIGAALEWIAL